jgi:hypothetical protein
VDHHQHTDGPPAVTPPPTTLNTLQVVRGAGGSAGSRGRGAELISRDPSVDAWTDSGAAHRDGAEPLTSSGRPPDPLQ